jgi:hypothetical protein
MSDAVVIGGLLKEDGTLELDAKPALPPGRMHVTLQPVAAESGEQRRGWWEVLQQIHRDQQARGYRGRTEEELKADEAAQRAEDEEYEERWRQIWSQTMRPPSPPEAPA